jgi:phosphate acyltransferase
MAPICIALDAMGGDFGPSVVLPAALRVVNEHPELQLILVGDADVLRKHLTDLKAVNHPQFIIHHASQHVSMDESPALALRNKKDSSMRVAINLVKENKAQACVSAGNTGALVATARFVLKTVPGVDRPAILARIPTMNAKPVYILDLGANVDSAPDHLLQFAIMGSVYASAVENIERPSLRILNIGLEDIKGNELVKATAQLLPNYPAINYCGYIEADEVFQGKTDIVICDGFVGNVALKASEGTAKLISNFLKIAFRQNLLTRLSGLLAMAVLRVIKKRMDPARYNGASLLGLKGIVIKSHGGTNVLGFSQAIEEAIIEVKKNVPQRITDLVTKLLASSTETIFS